MGDVYFSMVLACFTTSKPSKCSTPCQQASQIVSYIYGPHPPRKAGHDKIENREGVVKCKLGPARSLVSFFTAAPPPSQKISHSEDVLEVQLTFLGPPPLKCNLHLGSPPKRKDVKGVEILKITFPHM